MSRWLQNILPILAVVALLLVLTMVKRESPAPPEVSGTIFLDPPRALSPFYLIDQHGAVIDRARLEGRWTLLFFGYLNCPEVCSATLAALAAAQEQLSIIDAGSEELQVMFVSVDPHRDTPEAVARYLSRFNAAFVGAVAEPTALSGLGDQFGVTWRRGSDQPGGGYSVEHSPMIFVINPDVQWCASLSPPLKASLLTEAVRAIRTKNELVD
ncbi:protein SCO1 [Gammaproteobacteria bacterium]